MINIKNKFTFILSILVIMLFLSGCGQKAAKTSDKTTNAVANVPQSAVPQSGSIPASAVPVDDVKMVDCGKVNDPSCFIRRMNQCLPVTTKMTGSDGSSIDITVLGIVNETCHFQRKINDVLNIDCYFPKGTMNMDTLDQTFGNDKGLQKVVDGACKSPGW